MTRASAPKTNDRLDLVLERLVDVPIDLVWAAWTIPEHVKKWFTPAPWSTVDCEIDLRPGGIFRTVMRSPEGAEIPNVGCYLEVVRNEKLVWTNVLAPGYRPSRLPTGESCEAIAFTAIISLEAAGTKTRYTALVMHGNEDDRSKHQALGFHDGWGTALDQLIAVARAM